MDRLDAAGGGVAGGRRCVHDGFGRSGGEVSGATAVEVFSPQGTLKAVRQAQARFDQPVVTLGDPRAADPFMVDCPVAGSGKWLDDRTWVYDFERDLPGAVRCVFRCAPD